MDPNFDEAKTYSPQQREIINNRFSLLYDEYFIKLNNRRAKNEMQKTQSKIALQVKMMFISECITTLIHINNNAKYIRESEKKEIKVYETVKKVLPNFKNDTFASILENVDKLTKILTTLELEYERKYGLDKEETNKYSFDKQLIDVEQVLGRSIDVEKCSAFKWLEYLNKVQEIIKENEKTAENGKRKR